MLTPVIVTSSDLVLATRAHVKSTAIVVEEPQLLEKGVAFNHGLAKHLAMLGVNIPQNSVVSCMPADQIQMREDVFIERFMMMVEAALRSDRFVVGGFAPEKMDMAYKQFGYLGRGEPFVDSQTIVVDDLFYVTEMLEKPQSDEDADRFFTSGHIRNECLYAASLSAAFRMAEQAQLVDFLEKVTQVYREELSLALEKQRLEKIYQETPSCDYEKHKFPEEYVPKTYSCDL